MGLLATKMARWIARSMFVYAALVLALGPALDSAAKAAHGAPPDSFARVLVVFDVIDDVLDHLPGQAQGAPQQQLQSPHALPESTEVAQALPAGDALWSWERQLPLSSTNLDSQDPPPRA